MPTYSFGQNLRPSDIETKLGLNPGNVSVSHNGTLFQVTTPTLTAAQLETLYRCVGGSMYGSSRWASYRKVTSASYTVTEDEVLIGINFAGACTINLASAYVSSGRRLLIKDESGLASTNNITIATEGAELIDGVATRVINTNYGSVGVYSDGTNWFTL